MKNRFPSLAVGSSLALLVALPGCGDSDSELGLWVYEDFPEAVPGLHIVDVLELRANGSGERFVWALSAPSGGELGEPTRAEFEWAESKDGWKIRAPGASDWTVTEISGRHKDGGVETIEIRDPGDPAGAIYRVRYDSFDEVEGLVEQRFAAYRSGG